MVKMLKYHGINKVVFGLWAQRIKLYYQLSLKILNTLLINTNMLEQYVSLNSGLNFYKQIQIKFNILNKNYQAMFQLDKFVIVSKVVILQIMANKLSYIFILQLLNNKDNFLVNHLQNFFNLLKQLVWINIAFNLK